MAVPKIYSRELIELIFSQAYCRIGTLMAKSIAKRQADSKYLKALAGFGVLEEEKVGRDTVFIHRKSMTLMGADHHTFEPYPAVGPR